MQDIALAQKICEILYDKKAKDILALDVRALTSVCEYMVIASGRSTTQVHALSDEVVEKLTELEIRPRRIEGAAEARWVILDYGFITVHIFHVEEREYYHLERLWEDGQNRLVLPFDQSEL